MVEHEWTRQQQQAIDHRHGPLRIIAGAGSGKTATMTEHIARLIKSGSAEPEQIVALTFTNAAASELSERIRKTIGDSRVDVWSGTYHSFGGQIVSDAAETLDMPSQPRLLSQVEVWLLVRQILRDGIEIEQRDMANFGGAINSLVDLMSRCKDELVTADAVRDYIGTLPDEDSLHAAEMRDFLRVYKRYREVCQGRGAIDFGDQIQLAVHALDTSPELLADYRERYRFFVVDEYQDTNYAQAELVKRLAAPDYHLRIVGDPQQSIYRFRGAAVDNIQRFSSEIEGVRDVTLSTNFRSHQRILDVANRIVGEEDIAAVLEAHHGRTGPAPVVAHAEQWNDETEWVAETLAGHWNQGTTSMAVLVRKRKLMPSLARALERKGVPFQLLGGQGLFEFPAVKDAVAMIRVLCDPSETSSAVRVLTSPRCGLNDHSVFALRSYLRSGNYINALRGIVKDPPPGIEPVVLAAAEAFCHEIGSLLRTAHSDPVDVLTRQIVDRLAASHPSSETRALEQLVSIAGQFTQNSVDTNLDAYVDYMDALSQIASDEGRIDTIPEDDAVALMTIHGAKGLEFDVVVLAGSNSHDATSRADAVNRLIPAALRHDRDIYPDRAEFVDRGAYDKAIGEVEKRLAAAEERRLYYVAVTRARERLYMSWCERHPSRSGNSKFFGVLAEASDLTELREIPHYAPLDVDAPLHAFFRDTRTRLNPADSFAELKDNWIEYWRGTPLESEAMTALDDALGRFQAIHPSRQEAVKRVRRTLEQSTFAPLPRSVFSYSQISAYETCPRLYLLRYVVGVPPDPAHDWRTALGSAFHDALHSLHLARESGRSADFRELVRQGFDEKTGDFEASATQTAIKGFLNSPDAKSVPLATEQEFYLRLGHGRDAPVIRGFIDRIQETPDGEIEIVDYKTNRQNKSREQVLFDLQLPVYVMACREAVKLEPRYATMAFVRHDNWVRVEVADLDLTGARQRIDAAISGIVASQFDCTCGGSRCGG
jgi:DNA helicase II / ATP-dependent DNA helicase PcrA